MSLVRHIIEKTSNMELSHHTPIFFLYLQS